MFDYLFYAEPGSDSWKQLRRIKSFFDVATILTVAVWPFVFVALDPTATGAELTQWFAVATIAASILFFILASNVEVVYIRLKAPVALVDTLSALAVVVILLIYGEGFSLFGAVYCIGLFVNSYATEANEVDWRLNTRDIYRNIFAFRQLAHFILLAAAIAFRVSVFLKKVTVRNDVVLADLLGGSEVLSLRDLWEFCVDIVLVRSVYLSIARFGQPLESIAVGTTYAKLRDEDQ